MVGSQEVALNNFGSLLKAFSIGLFNLCCRTDVVKTGEDSLDSVVLEKVKVDTDEIVAAVWHSMRDVKCLDDNAEETKDPKCTRNGVKILSMNTFREQNVFFGTPPFFLVAGRGSPWMETEMC